MGVRGFGKAIVLAAMLLGGMTGAHAAGGGGSAGGSGAQNHPASGLPPGDAGPAGSPNNPHGDGTGTTPPDHAAAPPANGIRH